jgi:hypothetical protein
MLCVIAGISYAIFSAVEDILLEEKEGIKAENVYTG